MKTEAIKARIAELEAALRESLLWLDEVTNEHNEELRTEDGCEARRRIESALSNTSGKVAVERERLREIDGLLADLDSLLSLAWERGLDTPFPGYPNGYKADSKVRHDYHRVIGRVRKITRRGGWLAALLKEGR